MRGESAQFCSVSEWWLILEVLEQVVSLMRGSVD